MCRKSEPSKEGKVLLDVLKQAVTKTLERKRRLGQYSVRWIKGKMVILGDDAPKPNVGAN
jgi:hypothetical protein